MRYTEKSFEKYIVPALFHPWSLRTIQSAEPQPNERILDIACGTGVVARNIFSVVGPNGRIVGLDFKYGMLRMARESAEQEGSTIEWVQGRAEDLGFENKYFDLVVCQFGLMLFADWYMALSEMRRVLKKGGRIVVSVWQALELHPFYQTIHRVSQRYFGTSAVENIFSLGDADKLRRLIVEAGFMGVDIEPVSMVAHFQKPQEFLAWEIAVDPKEAPALRYLEPNAQRAVLYRAREEMQEPLREVVQNNQAVVPYHAYIARAYRP